MNPELQLPPWPKRRRWLALAIMTGYILGSSSLIGVGAYQLALKHQLIQSGRISKEEIFQQLVNDADFYRAIRKVATGRTCINSQLGLGYEYQPPLKPIVTEGETACLTLLALHQTGADVKIVMSAQTGSREEVLARELELFSLANTEILPATQYVTTRVRGKRNGMLTDLYVLGTERKKSWLVSYAPTSPTLDAKVQALVESLRIQ